ncbi:hypothetical protein ON010_g16674 [Phytophthora cinnamomi]|nr:hypothetical protein ON010_g16674 [Phytophthora cinnamomi]
MTRAHSKVHADKEPKLISSFLRLAVKNPRKADKARQDLYNSIAKSDRILEALLKKINTNKAECPVEKKAIIKIVEASQRNLHKALYRVSVTIQQRLREIEIPVPDWSDEETKDKKRHRSTSHASSTSYVSSTPSKASK